MNELDKLKKRIKKLNGDDYDKYIIAFIEPVEIDKKMYYELDYRIYARNNDKWSKEGNLYFDTMEETEDKLLVLAEENNVGKTPKNNENWFLGTGGFDIHLCVCDMQE